MIRPPPRELMFDGPPDHFEANGREFLGHYRDICGLMPHERVLDVGCGIGRKTIPLTTYLQAPGWYEGIDCKREGIEWCQRNITPRFPNFQFQHFDIYTPGYNPTGTIRSIDFCFPYEDGSFDFVTLCSVFTHMQFDAMRHYLHEVVRVLRPGGRCFISYFLRAKTQPHPGFPFAHEHGWMTNRSMPEQAIAFDPAIIKIGYINAGLTIRHIYHGSWYGRAGLSYQDLILAEKI